MATNKTLEELKKKLRNFIGYTVPQTAARIASNPTLNRAAQGIDNVHQNYTSNFNPLTTLKNPNLGKFIPFSPQNLQRGVDSAKILSAYTNMLANKPTTNSLAKPILGATSKLLGVTSYPLKLSQSGSQDIVSGFQNKNPLQVVGGAGKFMAGAGSIYYGGKLIGKGGLKGVTSRALQGAGIGLGIGTGSQLLTGGGLPTKEQALQYMQGGVENSWTLAITNALTDKFLGRMAPKLVGDSLTQPFKQGLPKEGLKRLFARALAEVPAENTAFTFLDRLNGESQKSFIEDWLLALPGNITSNLLFAGGQGAWNATVNKESRRAITKALSDTVRRWNTPVTLMKTDVNGNRITIPMWEYKLNKNQLGTSTKDINELSVEDYAKAKNISNPPLYDQFEGVKKIANQSKDVDEIFTHGSYGTKPNPRDIDVAIRLKGSLSDSSKLIDEIKEYTRQFAPIEGKGGGYQNAVDITFIDNKGKAFVWDGISVRPSTFVPQKNVAQGRFYDAHKEAVEFFMKDRNWNKNRAEYYVKELEKSPNGLKSLGFGEGADVNNRPVLSIVNQGGLGENIPTQPKGVGGEGTPKTARVWMKSKFSNDGAYADLPVIRKEENITLYQGSKPGESRQFWTPDKKYAEQFGEVREKTGTFYKVDNGNRVTDVYVEALSPSTLGEGVKLSPPTKVLPQLPQKVQLESNMQQPVPQRSAAFLRKNQGLPTSTDIIAPKSKPYIEGKIVKSEREAIGEWDRAIQDYANGIKRTKRGVSFEPSQKKIVESQEKARIKTEMDEYKQWSKQVFGEANARTETKAIDDLTKQMKTSTNQSVLDGADTWKDKPRMSYGRETMERNFEDIMGADAPLMKSKLLEPVYKANADIARFKNKERAEIKALGIKPRSEESRLVQELGEGKLTIDEVRKLPNGEKIIHAESVLRQKYDQYLEQLNKVLVRNGYDPIPKRKDYFHHFEDLNGLFEQVGVSIKANDLPTDINGLTADFKPGRTFFSATLQRKGTNTAVDAITGIDKYLDGAANQIYHTDNIQRLRAFETAIREKYAGTKHLTNFAADLDEYINALAGKKSMVDRGAENFVGRTIYSGANLLKKQVGANMVGANMASAITNSIPITQTLATTNKISVGQAMLNIIKNVFKDDGFIDSSNFLTSRIGSDRLSINNWEKIQKGSGWLFKIMDNFTSQLAVRSKYLEGIGKGLSESEAMRLADAWGRKTLAGRSAGEMPTMFDPKTLGFITQFQLEVNNQLSFIGKDIPRNFSKAGAASAMAQLFVYSYIYNNLYEKAFGRRPAFDPIGVAQQTYEDYTNPDMKKGQATKNLVKNVSNQLPFVGMGTGGRLPIGSAIPDFAKLAQGETTWGKELKKPLFYLFPPTGGGQIKKSTEGVGAYSKGYSETDKGNIRYPVPQTATNLIRTAIAGQYSTPEARKYFREGETPMGEVQSQVIKASPDKTEIYNQFMSNRDETSLVNKVKEQIKGGKDITEKAEPTVYTMDGVETQGFKIGNKFVYVDEDGEATSKSISTIEKAQKSYDKGLIDAQYSLSADRLKRADDDAGWVDLTQQYVDYLTEYKTTLNEKTDAKDILTVENKIEDLQASIDKIKKGKKPKKISIKITAPPKFKINVPARRSFKIKQPKLTKLTSSKYSVKA